MASFPDRGHSGPEIDPSATSFDWSSERLVLNRVQIEGSVASGALEIALQIMEFPWIPPTSNN
jgi:hypothetical protein